jgi:ribonuclease BN (tRNA processing enzyme)
MPVNGPHLLGDCPSVQLANPSHWTLTGHSRAGERTGLWLDPVKLALDAGMVSQKKPAAVLLSHSHYDHTSALPQLVYSRHQDHQRVIAEQESLCGRPVLMPTEAELPVQRMMEAVMALSRGEASSVQEMPKEELWRRQGYHPFPVQPHDLVTIPGLKDLQVEVLPAYHRCMSVGYGLSSVKKKLRQKFHGAKKEEIIAARKSGEEVTEEVVVPEMVFFCDSTIENLTKHEEWKRYPVLVVECTGYPLRHTVESHVGHTHLSQLEEVMVENKQKQWVLLHASSTMRNRELAEEEVRLKSLGLNVVILRD